MIIRQFCARHARNDESLPSSSFPTAARAPPTADTDTARIVEQALQHLETTTNSLQADFNAHVATHSDADYVPTTAEAAASPSPPRVIHRAYRRQIGRAKSAANMGSVMMNHYNPDALVVSPPRMQDITLATLLANQTHLGHHTSLWNAANSSYIFGIREGIHIISLDITYAYLKRAAKVVEEVARRGGVILFVGTRKGQTDIIVRAAKRSSAYHIYSRWVPGTLSNGQQLLGRCAVKVVNILDDELAEYRESLSKNRHQVVKPDLVIVLNPMENEVCLHECGSYGIPTIGVIDTNANPSHVTYPIPANDDSLRSIALISGVLSRSAQEGQRLRKEVAVTEGKATYGMDSVKRTLSALEDAIGLGDVASQKAGGEKGDKEASEGGA
ncbi:hypothetical protein DV736_g4758, partial [Chaetothyriales sp. CBS 134916]